MSANPHFETVPSFDAARALLTFVPVEPSWTAGLPLESIRIHVRDHKHRELPAASRSLEAHYGRFSVSESRHHAHEARRLALDVSYGRAPHPARIAGREARIYELGLEPPPDDIDGRSPAVVVWHDGEMLYLVASHEWPATELVKVATSLYR